MIQDKYIADETFSSLMEDADINSALACKIVNAKGELTQAMMDRAHAYQKVARTSQIDAWVYFHDTYPGSEEHQWCHNSITNQIIRLEKKGE